MAEDYINELDDSLDDIEPVERTSELYEHFRVVVDKGQTPVRIDKYCSNALSMHPATAFRQLQMQAL